MLQAEIAAATGTARSLWWDAHSDATQATVKNLKLHWQFSPRYPQFPNGDSYDQVSMLPRAYEKWTNAETQNCIAALQKGHLTAVAWEPDLAAELHPEPSSSAYQTASSTSSRNGAYNNGPNHRSRSDTPASLEAVVSPAISTDKDLTSSKHYQRVMERLRVLLKNVTGHNFTAKQNTHILYDNPTGEGAYKWSFTDYFPSFPPSPPSKWSTSQCRLVEDALDNKWLSVTPLGGTRDTDSPMPEHTPTRSLRTKTTNQPPPAHQPPPPLSPPPNPDPLPPTEPIPALLAALTRDLTTAYTRTITTLTSTLAASTSTHHALLTSSLSRLAIDLAAHRSTEIATLKQQLATAVQTGGAREAELAQARAEGDAAGQQRAISDMGDVQGGLYRSHLQDLVRVRREARMEGYEAGFRAGVEQQREGGGEGERAERLGSLFSEVSEGRKSEEGSPGVEFGVRGGVGGIAGRGSVSRGEQRARGAEMVDVNQETEGYGAESEFQLQPRPGIIGRRRTDSSALKHPRDDDDRELYGASPPRATKVPKLERPDDMRSVKETLRNTEKRLILHKAPSAGLAQSLSGGLFLSSDEEVDDGSGEGPGEAGFSYF
ncbi:hypothetical protein VE03_03923 [Pseudogymnoascus sp. 23342-1-I1]|nr:hypothetical protein VE03_03923 [Pseudogymnoascus sp. 23342-1-I1]